MPDGLQVRPPVEMVPISTDDNDFVLNTFSSPAKEVSNNVEQMPLFEGDLILIEILDLVPSLDLIHDEVIGHQPFKNLAFSAIRQEHSIILPRFHFVL